MELIAELCKKNPEDVAILFNGKKLNEERVSKYSWFLILFLLHGFAFSCGSLVRSCVVLAMFIVFCSMCLHFSTWQTFADQGVRADPDQTVNPVTIMFVFKKEGIFAAAKC